MKRALFTAVLASTMALGTPVMLAGCGGTQSTSASSVQDTTQSATQSTAQTAATTLANGTYDIDATTDSSMFRSESCKLTVTDGTYQAELVLPGEGFSRLYFGTAEDAAKASDADIYDYTLNDEGKYTFTIPVSALDEDLTIAAYGQRRDTWYDHTINFHTPTSS